MECGGDDAQDVESASQGRDTDSENSVNDFNSERPIVYQPIPPGTVFRFRGFGGRGQSS